VRTGLGVVLLLAALPACLGSPSQVPGPARDYIEANPKGRVWATLSDGSKVVLENPRIISDTVFAVSGGTPVAVPADQLTDVSAKQVSRARTGVLVLGLGMTVGAILTIKHSLSPAPVDSTQYYECRYTPLSCD